MINKWDKNCYQNFREDCCLCRFSWSDLSAFKDLKARNIPSSSLLSEHHCSKIGLPE